MRRLLSWLCSWRSPVSMARRFAVRWERQSKRLLRQLEKDQERIRELLVKVQNLSKRVETDLDKAAKMEQQHQTAMEALRSENQVLSDTTVPTLVAQHKLLLERHDADTAIQVRRRVAAQLPNEE